LGVEFKIPSIGAKGIIAEALFCPQGVKIKIDLLLA